MKESVSVGDLFRKGRISKEEECPMDPKIGEIKSELEDVLGCKCSVRETGLLLDAFAVPTKGQLAQIEENLRLKNNLDVALAGRVENEHVLIVVEKCLRMIYPNMNSKMK